MTKKWEKYSDSDTIRDLGGGFQLVLECNTKVAYEIRGMVIADILARLNQNHCECGKKCDAVGYCDDCLGG